jgi:ankyrin repeat protein
MCISDDYAPEFIEKMIEEKSDEDFQKITLGSFGSIKVDSRNSQNQTLLMIACKAKANKIVGQLINKKADVEAADDEGFRALHHAVLHNNLEALKCLVEKGNGVDINAVTKDRNTALHIAAERGFDGVAMYLVQKKCSRDFRNRSEKTALYIAVEKNCLPVARIILQEASTPRPSYPTINEGLQVALDNQFEAMANLLLESNDRFSGAETRRPN